MNPGTSPGRQLGLSFDPAPTRRIWTVAALVGEVRQHIEREYGDLWVEGEISNLRSAPSGHIYFTLKDGEAQLPAVIFRRQASLLRFRPADGLHILLRGKVSVYEQRGQMQLVAEFLEPVGAGSLQIAFEQLRQRLQDRGLFNPERKKTLPAFPRCVGVVTSPAGAVILDFINIVSRRHAGLEILLYPAVVQGEAAAAEVAAGIAHFNRVRSVDVVVIARGGGSLEDLAPFNSEFLAEAIAASELPVISAIGHETDFTIADFVADIRAATPSAAAEIVTSALIDVAERVQGLDRRLLRASRYRLMQASNALSRVRVDSLLIQEQNYLRRCQQRVDDATLKVDSLWRSSHRRHTEMLHGLAERLSHQNIDWRNRILRERFTALEARMIRSQQDHLRALGQRLSTLVRQLGSLSPLAVLNRGYALVYDDNGLLVKTSQALTEGQSILTHFAHGRVRSRITQIERTIQES